MTKEVQTCQPHHTLAEPARLMWECDCGVVPVVDDARRVVGMVTDRDICMATYTQGKPPSAIPVQSVMAKNVVSCRVDEDLASAEQKMQKAQVRRLPVVDQDGVLVGILSLNDIARSAVDGPARARLSSNEVAATLAAISTPRDGRRAPAAASASTAGTGRAARIHASGAAEGQA
ncbi:MAG TPA: CBS domain-containing protein [Planctomycetota bacterium]|nr:CBS domain-containing protein [Planctomycetota bacterium]